MKGFKEFLMRGNLVELAVAVIIGSVFAKVVETFTKILTDFIGFFGGAPDFSSVNIGGVNIGNFINAVITFVITAAVVYFFVVKPYNAMRERFKKAEDEAPAEPTSEELLTEIRDLLRTRNV